MRVDSTALAKSAFSRGKNLEAVNLSSCFGLVQILGVGFLIKIGIWAVWDRSIGMRQPVFQLTEEVGGFDWFDSREVLGFAYIAMKIVEFHFLGLVVVMELPFSFSDDAAGP